MYEILATFVFCFVVVLISSIVINFRYKQDYGLDLIDSPGTDTGFEDYHVSKSISAWKIQKSQRG